ncbi:adenylate/guanylate cyclase domain-containing protein [Arthrobacter sp. zg-Y820]|uniref:adenylate/guanylate cyclase domain-containing protein n=1 Tax=unclassified Arthrobacter TaxID=235627 RepID=UPI001E5E45D6|nr:MULTISPECIES: adenylate/guanylate cyclase domain-containing protein [unclassified Arthrobacter]MCC9198061.1 adenylate/guanylate cyclase domain-containing protein [Arthrobacter sp. zg-Y820]MDK1280928.1 adenylate/guanylate cyclase domain-containing protein [Arthrobacter sp. zg.Y820]WIB10403.1 adenylate/guanylate cyclase domain-containing protein [Arthrobacter sp. zg-Y820]
MSEEGRDAEPAADPEPMTLSMPAVPPRPRAADANSDADANTGNGRAGSGRAGSGSTGAPADAGSAAIDREDVRKLEAQLIGGPRTLKRREAAAEAGVSLLSARKLWRAMGFPNLDDDAVFFTEQDREALTTVIELVRDEQLTEEAAISIMRSIGQMTDRMVVWQIEALVEEMVVQRGIPDAEARKALVAALPALIEPLEKTLVYAWKRQMNSAVQRLALRAEAGLASHDGSASDDNPLPLARAVGFADLVSYTSLSRQMNEKTLAHMVQRFEHKCAEIISVGGGRLVKTIGDEVLFNAETPEAGAEISLALAKAFTEDDLLPAARVSLVWGRVLSRLGDIYGPTVNLASRLTSLAEPGTVLTDASTAAALRNNDRFVLIPHQPRNVRGFGEIHPVTLARGTGSGLILD